MFNRYIMSAALLFGGLHIQAMEGQKELITLTIENSVTGLYNKQEYEQLLQATQKDKNLHDLHELHKLIRLNYVDQSNKETITERRYLEQELPIFMYLVLNGTITGGSAVNTKKIVEQFYKPVLVEEIPNRSKKIDNDVAASGFPLLGQIFDTLEKYKHKSTFIQKVVENKEQLQKMADGLYKKGKTKVLYATLGACTLIGMAFLKIVLKKYRGSTA